MNVYADVLVQENQKTHLRWKITSNKEQINILKKGTNVVIQSLDPDFFEQFSADITKANKETNYIENYKFTEPSVPGNPYKLEISLKDQSVELFSFYENKTSSYVLDFWINQDIVDTKKAAIDSKSRIVKIAPLNKSKPKKVEKKTSVEVQKALSPNNMNRINVVNADKINPIQTGSQFRDFRYGASFIWDYSALIPPIENDINMSKKAPDYFYKIADRTLLDDKKEAHLQLSINFYNKKQWGLMTRSINLYEDKFGTNDSNRYLNDFMKATSMLKNVLSEELKPKFQSKMVEDGEIKGAADYSKKGIQAAARNLLKNVLDLSKDYEMNKSILRYLIQESRDKEDHIQALSEAKNLYVLSTENFDDDMIIYSSKIILNSLANLKQLEKVHSFLNNKAVMRVLPKQDGLAYLSYIHLAKDDTSQVIALYKANEKSLVKPIHPAIIYNTAEALFREAKYESAIKLFDDFIVNYSFLPVSSQSRMRLALSFDLLDKDYATVIRLYQDAINKSANLKVRYEAKLRYVGLRVNRNLKLDEKDLETISFLDLADAEKKSIGIDEKKLLWLTRLRSLISQEKYSDALSYLSTIPVDELRRVEQRVFHSDGAEIIVGVIKESYIKNNFTQAVRLWEIYKNKYENRVLGSPYLHFMVSDSYNKLGLSESFEREYSALEKLKDNYQRTFPIWVQTHKNLNVGDYLIELKLSKLLRNNEYEELGKYLEEIKDNNNINYKFYKAIVSFEEKKYSNAVASFESLLVAPNTNNLLTPDQSKLMIKMYLESLYESAAPEKFRKNALAVSADIRTSGKVGYEEVLQRGEYLYLESLFSEKKVSYAQLKRKSNDFLASFKESSYRKRVTYLNGVSKINSDEIEDGKDILSKLLTDKEVPEYLKGLARTELSSLELKNKNSKL